MLRRMLLAAIAAGLIAGALITLVQMITTMPLIHHAEVYEARGSLQTGARGHATDPQATADQDELERLLFTGLANLLAGVGFGLILVACLALYGRPIDRSQGVCWGLAGFAVFTLAPALGLPPEAPGGMTADLADRQAWWIFAGAAAACGLGLLRFGKAWPWRLVGIVALILPHLVGAPTPERFGGGAPPELTARFAATSIAVSAIFWALLGWLTAVFYERSQNARSSRSAWMA